MKPTGDMEGFHTMPHFVHRDRFQLYGGIIGGNSDGAPASLPPASSSHTHTRRMDGFCNHNADQLGSIAGLSLLTVYVGVV
jgi:hypothetical protein